MSHSIISPTATETIDNISLMLANSIGRRIFSVDRRQLDTLLQVIALLNTELDTRDAERNVLTAISQNQHADELALTSEIERLTRERDTAQAETVAARSLNHKLDADISTIGAALVDEAERRDWCAEYEEFISALNARLQVSVLATRAKSYVVEHVYTVTLTQYIDALSQDAAEDIATKQYHQIRESQFFVLPSSEMQSQSIDVTDINYNHDDTRVAPDEEG